MKKLITVTLLWICAGTIFAQPTVTIVPFATGFTQGISTIANAGAGDSRLFVVEQMGYVSIVDSAGNTSPNYFLNIHPKVTDNVFTMGDEQGLLGLAFSPQFSTDGLIYVNYTDKNGIGNTVISRFRVDSLNPDVVDTSSEEVLLYIQQPYTNHNGGDLNFGPDGYLYFALGDGGSANDPQNRAQNPDSLLGKMLRIDVSGTSGYSIPPTNPFAGGGGRPEIWAWGLRNPWKFCFDRDNGNLWIADVGQNVWEEIDFQLASSTGGLNYGWRCYEGSHPFNTTGCSSSPGVYTPPAYEYSHQSNGGCAVVGGYVYRGVAYPDLTGYYFYSDYCTPKIYTLAANFGQSLAGTFNGNSFTTFGENSAGELFIGSQSNGIVYRIASTMSGIEFLSTDIKGIDLFPNPNHGNFTCELEAREAVKADFEIVDITGRVCYNSSQRLLQGINTLDINMDGVQSGSYRMKIITDNGVAYEKFEIIR